MNFDDVSAVTSFGTAATGFKIGIVWSDQVSNRFMFAWRLDSDPLTSSSWHVQTAYGAGVGGCPTPTGSLCSDDHVNVKTNGDEIYVAVKTSLNDAAGANPADPLIALLRRSSAGSWNSFPVSPVSQDASRPMVLLGPALNEIYVIAQRAFSSVQLWRSSYSSPSFDPNAATPWASSGGGAMNDPTSTKQLVTESTGVVTVTSVEAQNQYWHNELQGTPTPPPSPSPSPSGSPGPAPTTLKFTPTEDASLISDQPNTNFGNATTLKVDNGPIQQALMKFNITGIAGQTVTSAKLRVHVTNPGPLGGDFRRVTGAWSQSSVTYNSRPSFDPTVIDSLGIVEENNTYEVDLTSAVTGDGQLSFLSTSASNNGVDYVSREGASTLRPQLVVTVGGAAPSPSPSPSGSPGPAPTTLKFTPTEDASLISDQPNANFGNATTLKVDNGPIQQALMKFNITGIAGQTVTSAKLRVHVTNPGPFGGDFRRVTGTWSQSTVTYNTRPTFAPEVLATLGAVDEGTWYELDLTSAVTGNGQLSLLSTSISNNGVDYVSREGAASLRPELVITLSP